MSLHVAARRFDAANGTIASEPGDWTIDLARQIADVPTASRVWTQVNEGSTNLGNFTVRQSFVDGGIELELTGPDGPPTSLGVRIDPITGEVQTTGPR
jgi:hypothetical protein